MAAAAVVGVADLIDSGSRHTTQKQGSVLAKSNPGRVASTPANAYVELLFSTESASTFSAGSNIECASIEDLHF